MKIRLLYLFLIPFFLSLYGCTLLIPEHETKTKADFYMDKKACDREARLYTEGINIGGSDSAQASEEMDYSRRCLKNKGWHYFKL